MYKGDGPLYVLLKINWRVQDVRVLFSGNFDEVQHELEVQEAKHKKWRGGCHFTYRRVG